MGFQIANQFYRNGRYEQAAASYMDIVFKNSDFYPVYVNLALCIKKINEQKKCEDLLQSILAKSALSSIKQAIRIIELSRLFDAEWYRAKYQWWLPENIDPLLHYLALGWRLGFYPSHHFYNNFYLKQQEKKVSINQAPLIDYLFNSSHKKINLTSSLSTQLWGGHSYSALKELKNIYTDDAASEVSRWWAMWHTARWLYFCGETQQALIFAHKMQQLRYADRNRIESVYLKYFCLLGLGRWEEAYEKLNNFIKNQPIKADTQLALANAIKSDSERIDQINQAFSIHHFVGIKRKNSIQPLSFSNVVGLPISPVHGEKKVSIIMPIFNANGRVHIAIESLLAQSYQNIEIIAVDDCSTDNTFDILKRFEKQDARIKAVQVLENGGAYAARNYGLKFAKGELITTHDSDDWSHPQKIAAQVGYLDSHPTVMGCATHWVRAQDNLFFTQNWRPGGCLTHWSHSSFMFRRKVLDTIGEWDHVNIGGDTEYICRMQTEFGKESFAKIHAEIPLAFALDEESSLTRTKATHVRTVYFGLRHIYREIYAWWHKYQKNITLSDAKKKRAFPAPQNMFKRISDELVFDNVIAGDFSRLADAKKAAVFIDKFPQRKIALFHWPDFERTPRTLCNLYFELLYQNRAEAIVAGQQIKANDYKITNENLKRYPLDDYPIWIDFKGWEKL